MPATATRRVKCDFDVQHTVPIPEPRAEFCWRCGDRPPSRPDLHLCRDCARIRYAEICADIRAAREAKACSS